MLHLVSNGPFEMVLELQDLQDVKNALWDKIHFSSSKFLRPSTLKMKDLWCNKNEVFPNTKMLYKDNVFI